MPASAVFLGLGSNLGDREAALARAQALLAACLATEGELGRVRAERNGPRTIDIDILFYGDERRDLPGLTLPHPRLHERLFVLVPLAEVAPEVRHPVLGLTAEEMRRRCPEPHLVRRQAPPPR